MSDVESLRIYKKALEITKKVYLLINDNPILKKDFSLCDQMKRACVSVPANISEGYMRSKKQFQHYLSIASGSSNEMVTLLKVVSLIYKLDTHCLIEEYTILGKQINSFSKSF